MNAKQDVSALLDEELNDAVVARTLDAIVDGVELRQAWCAYQLIGAALRGEGFLEPGAEVRFGARLDAEPTVLCPGVGPRHAVELPAAWAAAAAVAGISLVVWAALGMQPENRIDLSRIERNSLTRTAGATPLVGSAGEEYLLAHQGGSPSGALSGFSHYARTVAAVRVEGAADR